MENIPNSVQKEEIDALLLGLRSFYESMGSLAEELSYTWEQESRLDSLVLLQRYNTLVELMVRQVKACM